MNKVYFVLINIYITEMDHDTNGAITKQIGREICIPDSGTTHTILRNKRYFSDLKSTKIVVNTISGPTDLIEGIGKANFALPSGTKFSIKKCVIFSKF